MTTRVSTLILLGLLCAGQAWAQQSIVGGTRARITDRMVVGGSTFGEVMRIVGSPTVSSGTGTMNPAIIDADGDVLEDSFTTVSTAGAHTWSAAGSFTSTLGVSGATTLSSTLTVLGATTLSSTAPTFRLYESDQAASAKYWAWEPDGGSLYLRLYDDTPSSNNAAVRLDRASLVPGDWRWGALLGTVRPENNGTTQLGSLTKQYSTAYIWDLVIGTLTAKEVIATIGGEVITAPTTSLTRDAASGDTVIYVKHNLMRTNDTVFLKVNGSSEKMLVTSSYTDCYGTGNCTGAPVVAGQDYRYSVTRNRQGSGAKNWLAGAAVINEGNVGDGNIWQFADRSSSVSDGYVGNVVSDGPVAYWRMVATTSTTTADLMGNVGVATETGTQSSGLGVATFGVGSTGSDPAWQNTGGAGSLTVANDSDLQITGDLTLEWIAYWEHSLSRGEHILSRVFNGEYYVDVDAAGVLRFCHGNGTTNECEVTTSAVMPVGSWHHYAIVRDTTSSPKRVLFYVDGVLVTTATYTQAVTTSTNTLYIGDTSGGTTQFDGYLDEVAIYNYQLSADRIRLHSEARTNDSISRFTIGPTLVGSVRTGTGAFDMSERWVLGNLAGFYGYNSVTPRYGLAAGNYAADWIGMDATNGFRNMYGDVTLLQAVGGNLFLTGDFTMGQDGVFSSGTKPDCSVPFGTGIYMAYNGGSPVFCVGTPADYVQWDGSDLTVSSNEFSVRSGGVFVNTKTNSTFGSNYGYNFDSALSGTDPSLWAWETSGVERRVALHNDLTQANTNAGMAFVVSAADGDAASIFIGTNTTAANDSVISLSTNQFVINGNTGATAITLSCGAGQAVKTLTVRFGIVTAATCGAP